MTGVALYELAAEYRDAAERLQDLDLPPEVVADTLDSLSGDLSVKAENVARLVANLKDTAEAIKAAETRMADRRQAIERRAQSVRDYLMRCMLSAGIKKIDGPYVRLAIRDNPPSVDVFDPQQIPANYMRQAAPPPPSPDKTAIKVALQAGADVPGARLTKTQRIEIS